jgi:HTH-type transcriptional regulator / antitoxin HigA
MAKEIVRVLRSEADYDAALEEIERYFESEPAPGTPDADRFDLLALIVEDYERKRWPIEPPDAIDAIRYRMEMGGFTQADLGRLLGSRQRASDVLKGKRPLTMSMAWRLHREWGIPAEALIAPPPPRRRPDRGCGERLAAAIKGTRASPAREEAAQASAANDPSPNCAAKNAR